MVLDEISSQHLALRDYFGYKEAFSTLKLFPSLLCLGNRCWDRVRVPVLPWRLAPVQGNKEASRIDSRRSHQIVMRLLSALWRTLGAKIVSFGSIALGGDGKAFSHHLVPSVAGGFSRRMCLSYHLLTRSSTGSNDLHTLRKVRPPAWKPRWTSMKQTGGGCKWTTLFRSGQKVLP